MNKTLDIVFCCDRNYFEHLCVAAGSVLLNANEDTGFKFKILNDDFGEEEKARFKGLRAIKDFDVEFVKVDKSKFAKMPDCDATYVSLQTYFKYLIGEIFQNLDRILYLDVDICVREDLSEFYNTDFEGNLAVAAGDFYKRITELSQELGVENYFNAGVLLFNLKQMREEKTAEKLFRNTEILAKEGRIKFHDQCVFNYTLNGRVRFVSPRYNAQLGLFQTIYQKMYPEEVLKEAIKNPAIVHYTTEKKPWSAECPHPFGDEYFKTKEEIKKKCKNML